MRYVDEIVSQIEKQLDHMEDYALIKLENFQSPGLYFDLCKKVEELLKDSQVNLIAKLSREKYLEWKKDLSFHRDIELLNENGYVEVDGSLTKWRNENFLSIENEKTFVLLMGTELVVDTGGLADFYTISPDTIERSIGDEYSKFFHNMKSDAINNIYKNLFYYVEKDLFKLDKFAQENSDLDQEVMIKSCILESLDEAWGFPSFRMIEPRVLTNMSKRIGVFNKAHKFNRRIGMDNLPSAKKIFNLSKKIDQYYEKYRLDVDSEFELVFPGYTTYSEVKNDLIDYYSGIDIDAKREKLIRCDFATLDKIIGMKVGKTQKSKNRDIKVYGNPINAIHLSFIKQVMALRNVGEEDFSSSRIEIEQIKLANVIDDEDSNQDGLVKKWNKVRRFIKGIDTILQASIRNNFNEEFNVFLISTSIDDVVFDPFDNNNVQNLVKSGILKAAAFRDSVSKITFSIEIFQDDSVISSERYVWYIFDKDAWVSAFDIIDDSPKLVDKKIDEISHYLPIGVCEDLESATEANNDDEFFEVYDRAEIDYLFCNVNAIDGDTLDTKAYHYGKSFIKLLRNVEEKGFLGIMQSDIPREYFKHFREYTEIMLDSVKNSSLETKVYRFSKAMTIVSKEKHLDKKGAQITMIPAYHPVMLEKMIQRYLYLCIGIDEILNTDFPNAEISNNFIDKKYAMLDQLATITSATATTINEMNRFEGTMKSYGYTTLFGKAKGDVNFNTSFTKEDDELESVSGKLISTPVSNYIRKTIRNYLSIYPYKQDGLIIMFFNPKNFSDIIAALKGIVDDYKGKNEEIRIEIVIYTTDYRCKVYNYVKSWIDSNITEDDLVDLLVRIQYVDYSSGNSKHVIDDAIQDSDITFMFEIMEDVELKEVPIEVDRSMEMMFPSTYLPIPKNDQTRRFLSISQLQFECEDKYTQLITTIKSPHIKRKSYQIQTESKLREEFIEIIKILHEKSNWVVILDENVDPSLIKFTGNEIIGYSTGEGYFGELNATISSSDAILTDIRRHLVKRMKKEFSTWDNAEIKKAANKCIDYANKLDGAEVLKAINPNDEAIKDYLAFYLSTKIELDTANQSSHYYRKLLSLDLYDQIFGEELDYGNDQMRPDFLLIEVPRESNSLSDNSLLRVNIKIIECKMGSNTYMGTAIDKAKKQVYSGFSKLENLWDKPKGVKRRYWHNQLYKILTLQNSINLNDEELDQYTKKVMGIFGDFYSVQFANCIYSFNLEKTNNFELDIIHNGIKIKHFNIGSITTRNLLLDTLDNSDYEFISSMHNDNSKKDLAVVEPNMISAENINPYGETSGLVGELVTKNIVETTTLNESSKVKKEVERNPVHLDENDITQSLIAKRNYSSSDRMIHFEEFRNIFHGHNVSFTEDEEMDLKSKLDRLDKELKDRKTKIYINGFVFGPDIIRIELDLATGVNINQLKKYDNDMKYWLSINEKPFIYIKDGKIVMDIIRDNRQTIGLKNMLDEVIESRVINDWDKKFYALLGADILGNPLLIDFSDSNTPHLLIAGQTGSGKSVLLNSMLLSVMMIYTPDEVEMILVDPKFIELSTFSESPYTKTVITEAEQAVKELERLVSVMNERYISFMESKSKNLSSYNKKTKGKKMKRILMVFDEYAALMEENKDLAKRLESAIKILSQKARAAGIHLIICTQSPRADIITTIIRNNMTARVGLRVSDSHASSLILDSSGAETLLGKGDMLLKTASSSEFLRAKSPFVTEEEIEAFIEVSQEVYNAKQ